MIIPTMDFWFLVSRSRTGVEIFLTLAICGMRVVVN